MKKTLPDTGGLTVKLNGAAYAEARQFRCNVKESKDSIDVKGKKYFVSDKGNDSFDGSSPEKAFKTLQRLALAKGGLRAGDGVFLERNSVFRISEDFELVSGVTYCAYGQGNKPEIYGSYINYAKKDIWVMTEQKNIWKIAYFPHTDAGIIVFDNGAETGKKQIKIEELTDENDFCHDWLNNELYLYCERGNPGEVFNEIEIGTKVRIFHLPENSHDIVIDNISFAYTGLFGIRADEHTKNISVTNCKFAWIGGSLFNNKSNRFGNGVEFCGGFENVTIRNCSFDQIFDSGVTFQIGNSPFINFTVTDCLFEYNGMSGFEWWTGGDSGEKDGIPIDITVMDDIIFERNLVRLTGFGWSKATRSPAHIRNAWRPKWYPNMKNFEIKNNIFDCSNGQIIGSSWHQIPDGYCVCGNTYYQQHVDVDDPKYGFHFFDTCVDKSIYLSSATDFSDSVKAVDKSPEKIEWISLT